MRELFNKIFLFLYIVLISITPLMMFDRTSELFEFNKIIFIYLITILILSIWIGKMIIYRKIIIKKTIFDIPIFLFLLSQILSTIFSIDRHTSIFGYYGRFNGGLLSIISYLILYYAFVSNIEGDEVINHVSTLLKTSLVFSAIVILWGLPGKFGRDLSCFLFTGVLNNNCWTEQFKPAERMFSTLGQPNWLGAYLAINFFIGLYFFFKQNSGKYFIFYFLYLILNFSAILFTRSRSALFAIICGLFLFFLLDLSVLSKKILPKKYLWLCLLLLIPILLFKTGVAKIDKFLEPKFYLNQFLTSQSPSKNQIFKEKQSLTSFSGVTESGEIRKIVWKGAIDLGLRYPFFGTGVETFAYAYYFVRPKEHNLTSEWDFIYNKAHNEYLNYLATTGFIGLGTYLLLIAIIIFHSVYKLKVTIKNLKFEESRITNYQLLITCLLLAHFSILITNFFGFSTTIINLYFYLIPAFLFSIISPNISHLLAPSTSLAFWQKILLFFAGLIFLIGLIFPITYFLADTNYALADNYQKIQDYSKAYLYLTKALSYKYEHVYEDKLSSVLANLAFIYSLEKNKQEEVNQSINQLIKLSDFYNLKSIKASPKNVLYWKTRAKNYYLFYQIRSEKKYLQEATKALEVAKKLSPTDPKLYYTQAMIILERAKEKNKALKIIEKAIELKPDYRDGYYAKGIILKTLGRKKEAKEVFQYILKNINPSDEEVKKEFSSY